MSYTEIGRIGVSECLDEDNEVEFGTFEGWINKAEAIGLITHFTKVFELGEGESQEDDLSSSPKEIPPTRKEIAVLLSEVLSEQEDQFALFDIFRVFIDKGIPSS